MRGGESKAVHTGIPDLRFYPLVVYRGCAGGELDSNRRPTFEIEFIAHEAGKHFWRGDERCCTIIASYACVQFLCRQEGEHEKGFSGYLRANQQ